MLNIISVTAEAASAINRAKSRGGRVIAVGTTSARTLETIATANAGKSYRQVVGHLFSFIRAINLASLTDC